MPPQTILNFSEYVIGLNDRKIDYWLVIRENIKLVPKWAINFHYGKKHFQSTFEFLQVSVNNLKGCLQAGDVIDIISADEY